MRRRALIAVAGAALLLVGLSRLLPSSRGGRIPVYQVRKGSFARHITTDGVLSAYNSTPVTAPGHGEVALKIAWMAPDGTPVAPGDVLVRFDPTEFEERLRDGKVERASAANKMTKTVALSGAEHENLKRDASQAERELEAARTFQKKDREIFSRSQIIESEIDEKLAAQRKTRLENVHGIRSELSRAEQDLVAIEQRKADSKVRQSAEALGSLEVRAPHAGIFVLTRDWRGETPRVGETFWSGEPVGQIPELSRMRADVFVLEADAGGVAVGQSARVTVESDPGKSYRARVARVDSVAKPRLRNVPVQYFGVTLDLDSTDPATMKPGARVQAVLDVDSRTGVLAVPLEAVFEKNGHRIVYRRMGDRWVETPVEIGGSSLGRVVVEKGLAPGEWIALADPGRPRDEKPTRQPVGASPGGSGP